MQWCPPRFPLYTCAFHLKEALSGFSLARPDRQLPYSCALGPFISKIRWLEHKPCNVAIVNLITETASPGLRAGVSAAAQMQGWFTSPAVWSGTVRDFITLIRTARNMNCFWNFPFNVFWPGLTEATESENANKKKLVYLIVRCRSLTEMCSVLTWM